MDLSQRPGTQYQGLGCLIPANAMASLESLGVGEAVKKRAQPLNKMLLLGDGGNRTFGEIDLDEVRPAAAPVNQPQPQPQPIHCRCAQAAEMAGLGSGFYGARLEHIHSALGEGLKACMAQGQRAVTFGTSVKAASVTKEGRAAISLTGKGRKKQLTVDLLIGADGVGSNVRHNLMTGAPETPIKFSGFGVWHIVVERLPSGVDPHTAVEIWGAGGRLGLVPLAGGQLYCTGSIAYRRPEQVEPQERVPTFLQAFEGYRGHGSEETLRAIVTGDCGTVDLTMDYPAHLMAAEWHHQPSRAVLIGDAAHAFSHNAAQVYAGQSVAAALQDATGLAEALQGVEPAGVDEAVSAWCVGRSQAVSVEQAAALKVTRESQQSVGGVRAWLQTAAMSAVGSVGSLGYPALLRRALVNC